MSINLSKMETQNKTKMHLMSHHRHKSEIRQRSNPWDTIGKALTHRYNQKYDQMTKKYQQEQTSIQFESAKLRAPIPKFKIKRKYLSFNFDQLEKRRENSLEQSKKPLQAQTSSLNKSNRKLASFSSIQYYKTVRQSLNMLNKAQTSPRIQLLPQNVISTFSGVYLVPSTSTHFNKQKHKGIYMKKSKWKMNINPQLKISEKKREIKEEEIIHKHSEDNRPKISYIHEGFRPNKRTENYVHKPKQKKMFRPWSGYSQDQNQ